MIGYHGTSSATASKLAAGQVDVGQGGGELGQGFYLGEWLHLAKAWAAHVYEQASGNVVEFSIPDAQVDQLDYVLLERAEATMHRHNIRRSKTTRTHQFDCDMVWSPIVGSESVIGDQTKWESKRSETLLNGAIVIRRTI